MAVPLLDAVIDEARAAIGNDSVVAAIRSIISVEQIESGEPVRAADALIVAEQLDAAIGPRPPLIA
jgi:hypothetical protein